ncbi:helix-turn-helix domain-containing protein [Mesorhizobium sp. M1348]|uniref:helix-turn-helix domain-containing protein n=1 Tax=Mesorhizobium sp. M1348 TaxID=2957089 RepID=UPI003336400A
MMAEMSGDDDANPEPSVETSPKLDGLRRSRRNQRSELYAEVLDLRTTGMSPRQIAPRTGMSVRTVERWLAAGGEPEHRRPPARSVLIGSLPGVSRRTLAGRPTQPVAPVERNQAPRLCRQQGDRLKVDRRPPAVLIDRSAKCAMAAAVAPKLCMAAERRPDFAR